MNVPQHPSGTLEPDHAVQEEFFSLQFHPGRIVVLTLSAGMLLDERTAKWITTLITDRLGKEKCFLLAESEGFFQVTKKARQLGADPLCNGHLDSVAMFTKQYSLALLAELYMKINRPSVPTRLFMNRDEAIGWLQSRSEQAG